MSISIDSEFYSWIKSPTPLERVKKSISIRFEVPDKPGKGALSLNDEDPFSTLKSHQQIDGTKEWINHVSCILYDMYPIHKTSFCLHRSAQNGWNMVEKKQSNDLKSKSHSIESLNKNQKNKKTPPKLRCVQLASGSRPGFALRMLAPCTCVTIHLAWMPFSSATESFFTWRSLFEDHPILQVINYHDDRKSPK